MRFFVVYFFYNTGYILLPPVTPFLVTLDTFSSVLKLNSNRKEAKNSVAEHILFEFGFRARLVTK